jgi:hypothetical protein
MSAPRAFDPTTTFVQLHDGPAAVEVPVGDDFWATIGERTELHAGRLLTVSAATATRPHWEMHPDGDEFVLEEDGRERTVALGARTAFIVPQGTWHRAIVHEPGEILFVTRGSGTQHRPR